MRHRLIHLKPLADGAYVACEDGSSTRPRYASVEAAIAAITASVLGHARAHVVVHDPTGAIVRELIVGPDRGRIVAA
jgi:hypothetical protein